MEKTSTDPFTLVWPLCRFFVNIAIVFIDLPTYFPGCPNSWFRKEVESHIIKVMEMNKITTYLEHKFVSPDILKPLELINSTSN